MPLSIFLFPRITYQYTLAVWFTLIPVQSSRDPGLSFYTTRYRTPRHACSHTASTQHYFKPGDLGETNIWVVSYLMSEVNLISNQSLELPRVFRDGTFVTYSQLVKVSCGQQQVRTNPIYYIQYVLLDPQTVLLLCRNN